MTTDIPWINKQYEFDGWIERLAAEIVETMLIRADKVDSRDDQPDFQGYNNADIEQHISEEVLVADADLEYVYEILQEFARTPVTGVDLSDFEKLDALVHGTLVNEIGYNVVYFTPVEYLAESANPTHFHRGAIDDTDPDPYLWLGHTAEVIEDPIWFLPLDSQVDSEIWRDSELEIEIVWWQ